MNNSLGVYIPEIHPPEVVPAVPDIPSSAEEFYALTSLQKHGETEFLTHLLTAEMTSKDHPDAVIFAGPKVMLDDSVSQDALNQIATVDYPVFYMNFNLNPQANPWRDAIGSAVKHLKGFEYTITRPRDLWFAWTEIMTRITKFRVGKSNPASSQ